MTLPDKKWLLVLPLIFVLGKVFLSARSIVQKDRSASQDAPSRDVDAKPTARRSESRSVPEVSTTVVSLKAGPSEKIPNSAYKPQKRRRMPNKGEANFEKVERQWYAAVLKEGFHPRELPFKRGMLQESEGAPKTLGVWPDISGYCRLEIDFDSKWDATESRSICK